MKTVISFVLLLSLAFAASAQEHQLSTHYFFPKDSLTFERKTGFGFEDDVAYPLAKFGNTTLIIRAESMQGIFYFVMKKKLRAAVDQPEAVTEFYGQLLADDDASDIAKADDSYLLTDHDLYGFIFVEDHGGLLLKARFQDFGNPVYWPQFDYPNCFIADADGDGYPEFYLSYMGDSDGLDAKPYKQIVYYFSTKEKKVPLTKSKATAYYPSGNEEDVYHVDYDLDWKAMPDKIRQRSALIIAQHKKTWID